MPDHLFPYEWNLTDGYPAKGIDHHGLKVFGTFICGGGSSMGYKLAGYDCLGGVDIDPQVTDLYKTNHNPKYLYTEDLRRFNRRSDLPDELYHLDILDGSPPCSTFSVAGSREGAWGKEKQFREGQSVQILDDLVFVYCDTIIKLKPKVFILENVKGLIQGNAKVYAKKIVQKMAEAGYTVKVFLLNAASMGVPQRRERVFFIGHRAELIYPDLKLFFNEAPIPFGMLNPGHIDKLCYAIRPAHKPLVKDCCGGKSLSSVNPNGSGFNTMKQGKDIVSPTVVADSGGGIMVHYSGDRYCSDDEYKQIGTFPMDYNFKKMKPKYIIGMSVPPVMIAQIANQIYQQWFRSEASNAGR